MPTPPRDGRLRSVEAHRRLVGRGEPGAVWACSGAPGLQHPLVVPFGDPVTDPGAERRPSRRAERTCRQNAPSGVAAFGTRSAEDKGFWRSAGTREQLAFDRSPMS